MPWEFDLASWLTNPSTRNKTDREFWELQLTNTTLKDVDFMSLEFFSPTALGDFSSFPFDSPRLVSVLPVRDPMMRMQSDFSGYGKCSDILASTLIPPVNFADSVNTPGGRFIDNFQVNHR
jgi:hypothetical protein